MHFRQHISVKIQLKNLKQHSILGPGPLATPLPGKNLPFI